jgi:hypothetical protein
MEAIMIGDLQNRFAHLRGLLAEVSAGAEKLREEYDANK